MVDVLDIDSFAKAICQALASSPDYRASNAAIRFAQYNTKENYHRVWHLGVQESPTTTPFLEPDFLVNHAN